MYLSLQQDQVTTLREILTSALKELRVESARTDTRAFRDGLREREKIVESILAKLSESAVELT